MKNLSSKSEQKFQRVMHEFGQGELKSHGRTVDDQKQALAIAFSEARKVYPNYGMMKKAGEINPAAVKGLFSLDAIEGKKFSGYTFGDDWNGWATPYFERPEANLVMEALGGTYKDGKYLFDDGYDGEEYEKETIDTVDGPKEVYAIGAYSWTWNNDLMKNGGGITGEQAAALAQIYKTGTAKQLWEAWTPDNRTHFLMDHAVEFFELMGDDYTKSSNGFAVLSYDTLPSPIKKSVLIHHAQGMYAGGGGVKGDQLQLFKDRLDTIAIDLEGEDEEMLAHLRYDLMDDIDSEVANIMVTNFENNELNKISDKKMVDQIKKAIGNYRSSSIGKTPQQVWKAWNMPERLNFIVNHTGKQHTPRTQDELANKAYIFLPKDIKQELNKLYSGTLMAKGGGADEGIDLFEDYENIPPKVQRILTKYEEGFEEGDYEVLKKALAEVEKQGYTFEYYLDGQAFDLRKIGQKGKSEGMGMNAPSATMAGGGGVEEKQFLSKDLSGRGEKSYTLTESHIRKTWDLDETDDDDQTLSDFLDNSDDGDTWRNGTEYLENIGTGNMAGGGGIPGTKGGRFKFDIGDKVMVDDTGFVKKFEGFDLTKPATIRDRNKSKSGGKTYYFYKLTMANGDKPFNQAEEDTLTIATMAGGGGIPSKLSPAKKKLLDRINTLKAAKANAGEAAQKSIQKKIDVLQKQFDYNPSAKERARDNKGKFALDVPASYSKGIYKKLWSMKIMPRIHKLNGTHSIVVSSKVNLDKAFEVYSDMLKEKKEKVPGLSTISRKL